MLMPFPSTPSSAKPRKPHPHRSDATLNNDAANKKTDQAAADATGGGASTQWLIREGHTDTSIMNGSHE